MNAKITLVTLFLSVSVTLIEHDSFALVHVGIGTK